MYLLARTRQVLPSLQLVILAMHYKQALPLEPPQPIQPWRQHSQLSSLLPVHLMADKNNLKQRFSLLLHQNSIASARPDAEPIESVYSGVLQSDGL